MHKIDVNVAGLDHNAIHEVIWCSKSVRLRRQCEHTRNSG